MPKKPKEFYCEMCFATDITLFYTTRKNRCKKCCLAVSKSQYVKHPKVRQNKQNYNKEYSKMWQQKNLFKHRVNCSKHRAKKIGLEFNLTEDHLKDLWAQQDGKCFYSGLPMNITERGLHSLSLDRRDNSLGYIIGNVVLCLWLVNTMKNSLSVAEFFMVVKSIAEKNQL